ncbi:Putative oxidoreductase SadH [Aquicella siphonis]|uniref:Oxidoreductase SadH n=1 Tax=Aquicella siphonis TaxID=254247 RepID=A0A5E4PFR9_9COXI|nr:SDR family NAD(P)-dependent oxidoreductase [Aquicella siphonis]VVC75287.1 Putative oxidoreductase SadH [Aquicella siphonis]
MESKSILITGCSSGIGFHAAAFLKDRGYRVFATARKPEDVETLKAHGFDALQLDVNDSPSIRRALDHILDATDGTLYALFNNAGYLQAGAVEDLSRDAERAQFETNVFGPMELVRLTLPIMRRQGYGRIIQNSSILGVVAMPFYGAYNASKFALEGFSNTLRQELRGTPIHVSILNPGPITTHLRENAFQVYQRTLKHTVASPYQKTYKKMEQTYFAPQERKIAQHPEAVVKKLLHALESPRPRTRYYIGLPAHILAFLKRILPDSALDWVIYKIR